MFTTNHTNLHESENKRLATKRHKGHKVFQEILQYLYFVPKYKFCNKLTLLRKRFSHGGTESTLETARGALAIKDKQ